MKMVDGKKSFKEHLEKLSNSFKVGIEIVEDKILSMKKPLWCFYIYFKIMIIIIGF